MSASRTELDAAKAQAESRYGNSKGNYRNPREADALKEKVAGFQSRVAEAEKELEAARSRIEELKAAAKPQAEEKRSEAAVG